MEVNGSKIVIEIDVDDKNATKKLERFVSTFNKMKTAKQNPMSGFAEKVKEATNKALSQDSLWKDFMAGAKGAASFAGDIFGAMGKIIKSSLSKDMKAAGSFMSKTLGFAAEKTKSVFSSLGEVIGGAIDFNRLKKRFRHGTREFSHTVEGAFGQVKEVAKSAITKVIGEDNYAKIKEEFSALGEVVKIAAGRIFKPIAERNEGNGVGDWLKKVAMTAAQPVALIVRGMAAIVPAAAKAAKAIGSLAAKIGGTLLKGLKSAGSTFLSFAKKVALSPFKKAADGIKNFAGKVSQLASSFKRVLFYRAIRTLIKEIGDAFREGTKNLYFYSQGIGGQFAASMDMAATSMLYFKNSIGAAVAPLINALAPVLDMIVDKAVEVINVFNQLFAKLTGATSWTRAIKYPKQYEEAVKDSGKAAKEAMRYLAPFDELNVLPSDRAGGGYGASAAEDYSKMFEEMTEFNSSVSNFAKTLKETIAKSDWKGFGQLIGNKANEIVSAINWSGIGGKIGEYINSWFTAKYWTLKTINFKNIGSGIAELLNGSLGSIDFNTVGRSFSRNLTLVLDLALGFLKKLNWSSVGKSVGDFLRGSFDEVSDWSKGVNWKEFGKNLWKDLKKFIAGIDFGELARSFFRFLGSAFGAVVGTIGSFFGGVWKDVSKYFREKTREAGGSTWEGFKKGVVDAWSSVKRWVKENVVDPFIRGVKDALGIHSPSTVMAAIGVNVIDGFKNGISERWKNLRGWFEDKWNSFSKWWKGLELPSFKIKKPHISWTTEPASGWVSSVLSTLGLPNSLPKLNVNWYARGGIVDKASLIGAGEVGKEAIVPLERNTQWVGMVADQLANSLSGRGAYNSDLADDLEDANGVIVSAIFSATAEIVRAMQRSGGAQSNNIDIDQVAKQVTRWQNSRARANGV